MTALEKATQALAEAERARREYQSPAPTGALSVQLMAAKRAVATAATRAEQAAAQIHLVTAQRAWEQANAEDLETIVRLERQIETARAEVAWVRNETARLRAVIEQQKAIVRATEHELRETEEKAERLRRALPSLRVPVENACRALTALIGGGRDA